MAISRRNFLRFAPVSVGAVALGVVVLPRLVPPKPRVTNAMLVAAQKMTDPPFKTDMDRIITATQRAVDPPLMQFEFSTEQIYYIQPTRHYRRVFGFEAA